MKSLRKVLRLIPGCQFEFIDASCCGMAGSFGLDAEHADISRAMAELDLLPALRAAPDAPVLANGFFLPSSDRRRLWPRAPAYCPVAG